VLEGAGGSSWWLCLAEKWTKKRWKIEQKQAQYRGGKQSGPIVGKGLGEILRAFLARFGTKHELGFLVNIASFQLVQKSSNLVMFWLPKVPSNFTKNQYVKTINLG